MNKDQLLWKLTAEQFAAFDVHLYLDTHPNDTAAMELYNEYQKAYMEYKTEYESLYGPLTPDSAVGEMWKWIKNPWPWEKEAN